MFGASRGMNAYTIMDKMMEELRKKCPHCGAALADHALEVSVKPLKEKSGNGKK